MTDASPRLLPAVRATPASSVDRFDADMRVAEAYAKSGFFNDARTAYQCLTKIRAGRELGVPEIASVTGIYFVKGKLSYSANLMAAVVQATGTWRFRVKEHSKEVCTLLFQEKQDDGSWEDVGLSSFSMQDARDAGLAGSDTYKKFPRNMLYARAMSNGCRWFCPAAFGGAAPYTPDELDPRARMGEDGEYVLATAAPLATPKSEPADSTQPSCQGSVTDAEVVEVTPPPDATDTTGGADALAQARELLRQTRTTPAAVKKRFGKEPEAMTADELGRLLAALRQKAEAMPA